MNHIHYTWELPNAVLYDSAPKGVSKIRQVKVRHRVIQYLIWKLSGIVNMIQEDLVVAALLGSVRTSWKVTIYYINGALLKLNRYALYLHNLPKNDFQQAETIQTRLQCPYTLKWKLFNLYSKEEKLSLSSFKNFDKFH